MAKRGSKNVQVRSLVEFDVLDAPITRWPREIKKMRREVFPSWFADDSLPALFRHRGWIVLAQVNGRIVGYALCDFFEGETEVYLEEIAVSENYQNQSIGTNLVIESARVALCRGFVSMWATALSDEEHRGIWLHQLGLIPKEDGSQTSLSSIIAKAQLRGIDDPK